MSDLRLSNATRALLHAAKADGPDAETRAKMWTGVSGTIGGVAAAGGAAAAGGTIGTASAGKLIALGTLLGGAITVGIATLVIHFAPVSLSPATAAATAPTRPLAAVVAAPPTPVDPAAPTVALPAPTSDDVTAAAGATPAPPAHPARVSPPLAATATAPAEDSLTREASLVAEARGALGRGDAPGALRAVRAAKALPSRLLEPEELAVEAQALRALGRDDEAKGVDGNLRSHYPESALAR